jgi:hypothetical protein
MNFLSRFRLRQNGLYPIALLTIIMYWPCALEAQTAANGGEIAGQVQDPSGAAIAGAQISVRNIATNFARAVTSDTAGRYFAPQVPLGIYEVSVKVKGFAAETREATVGLGSSVSVNFHLIVGVTSETVRVEGDELALEPTQSPAKSVLTELQIRELPSNGGRLQNFVWEMPDSQVEPECRGMSVSGQKGIYANVSVDGGDYNSTFACATGSTRGGSGSAPTFNLDAIQEFEVTRNVFAAEFGRTTGGEINISTKSGTDVLHGDAFLLSRDQALSSTDVFGNPALAGNQQFGGSIGGAIRKDRTFFFVAPEIQLASKPVKIIYSVLDQQDLRDTAGAEALEAVAPDNQTVSAPSNAESVISRFDHQILSNNWFFARFDFTHTFASSLAGSDTLQTGPSVASTTNLAASNITNLDVWSGTVLAQLTSVLSSTRVNELRVQFGREDRPRAPQGTGPQVTVANAGATIATYGPQGTGISFGNGQFPTVDDRNQAADDFTLVHGAHTVKFGFDVLRISSNVTYAPGGNGVYTFSSLANYLNRVPSLYSQFAGSGTVRTAIDLPGLFLQDEWHLSRRVTISPGLRYEMQFNPDYKTASQPQLRFPLATSIPSDLNMWEPRLGVAWDLGGDGKTVIRAGSGIYYAPVNSATFIQSLLFNGGNPELGYTLTTTNAPALTAAFQQVGINLSQAPLGNLPVFTQAQLAILFAGSNLPGPITSIGQHVYFVDPHFVNPRALQFNIGVDREIAKNIVAGVDFTDVITDDITRQRDVNLGTPSPDLTGRLIYPDARPYGPMFGIGQMTEASAKALFRSVTTSLNVKHRHYVISAYYTLSWNLTEDDTEHPVGNIIYDSAANLQNEYNWSNLDMRHQFTTTGVYFLPHGFEVSNTARLLSGRPFTATAGSTDLNNDGELTDRPDINGAIVRRNTFRNTAFYDVDLRVSRTFSFRNERERLIVLADFFNLFNSPNVLIGSANMVWGPGEVVQDGIVVRMPPPSNFGELKNSNGQFLTTNTAGDPFQAQIGLRFEF